MNVQTTIEETNGLCAWCRHYFNHSTGLRVGDKLTDATYTELSNSNDTSHGCCTQCATDMKREARK